MECQRLLMEGMKYHLLPQHRPALQSPRTRPRKATVGAMFAVGGMDATKGRARQSLLRQCVIIRFVYQSVWYLFSCTFESAALAASVYLTWTKLYVSS